MARTFNALRLRHIRDMEAQLNEQLRELAVAAGALVQRTAVTNADGVRLVPNTRRDRERLRQRVWDEVIKPYFVGAGTDAFEGSEPRSPYARLLVEGIRGSVRLAAEQQIAFLRRHVRDREVLAWLTGPRPIAAREQRGLYDPYHTFVDPNGYRLSDRVWRTSVEVRARIDRLLNYHIAQGTPAVDIAELLVDFLTPGARLITTRTPYGREGSYAARRLARTEITAAAGRGTVNASLANPFVEGVLWALSGSHPEMDICDELAAGGPNGDGVYPKDDVPSYPAHPHCMCNLSPIAVGDIAVLVEELQAEIRAASPRARAMQGVFNLDWLVGALLSGYLDDVLERVL